MPASIPRAALAALACLALAASAHGGSIFQCSDEKCTVKQITAKDVKTDGACNPSDVSGYSYKCTADLCSVWIAAIPLTGCAVNIIDLPVNKVTQTSGAGSKVFFIYEDLTGAIVGGIIGGLAFIFLIAMWRFRATKTGPFAEGATFMTWITCKAPHSVVVGAK